MSAEQREKATKYAPSCILIDFTHGTSKYMIQVTTLMVISKYD